MAPKAMVSRISGAMLNTHLSALAGMMSSFIMNFNRIGNGLEQPVPAGPHRPEPRLHVREHLALHIAEIHGVGQENPSSTTTGMTRLVTIFSI